jgi:hypothetical protein
MNTEHLLPSTRIRAARWAAKATSKRLIDEGVDPRLAHEYAIQTPIIARSLGCSLELASHIASARALCLMHGVSRD